MTLSSIQALRFIAAFLVLLFHLEISYSGYKGVDLFFVISGFVIYYSTHIEKFADRKSQRKRFAINRLTKIFLLYWTSLLVLLVIDPFPLNMHAVGTFFLVPGHKSILGVSWSLSYELYFYFLFFLTFFIANKKLQELFFTLTFVITCFTTALLFTSYSLKGTWLNFLFGQNLWEFSLGILAARFFLLNGNNRKPAAVFLLPVFFFLFLVISMQYNSAGSYLIYGSVACMIVLCAVIVERRFPFSKGFAKLVNALGDASYAIYLFSPIIIAVLRKYQLHDMFVIVIVIILSVAITSFYEIPVLKFARKKIRMAFSY
jgi:exopolysaccharide production protein ExoZ